MIRKKGVCSFLCSVFLMLLLTVCSKDTGPRMVRLPGTPVLALESRWGVVSSNYLRLRANPSRGAEVVDGLTMGTVVEILTITEKKETIEDEADYWYRVDLGGVKGWLFGAYLEIRDSKAAAEQVAEEL